MVHVDYYQARARLRPESQEPFGRMIDTSCGRIEIATIGPADGAPLILVDHGMGSWHSLCEVGRQLSDDDRARRVIAWSRPGCGNSPPVPQAPGDDPLRHEARVVVPALMTALGIHAADFLGHGDGATVALMFAALHPERTRRVIAIAPVGVADLRFSQVAFALPESETESGLSARLGACHADAEASYGRWRRRSLSQAKTAWSALDMLSSVKAPLLLVQGMADEYNSSGQIQAVADAVAGPVSWVILRNQGHFLPQDVPEQIACLANSHLDARRRMPALHS